MGRSTRKEVVQKLYQDQAENVTVNDVKDTYSKLTDEAAITDEELLELAERRFGKALPMESINIVLIMEMKQ
jgi:hypothetical protein